jgi:hypothetical protein
MTEITQPDGQKKLVPLLPNGNNLVETNQHYCLILREGQAPEGAVISMTSSQLRSSRLWNTLVKKVQLQDKNGNYFTPASYYMTYKLTTVSKTNDKYSWFVYSVEPAGPVPSKALYDAGKALEKAVAGGTVKVKLDEMPDSHVATDSSEAPLDTEIPF